MRPQAHEHDPYYSRYIDLVPQGNIVSILETQIGDTVALFDGVGEERAGASYEPGKWTVKEVVGHLSDTERIMAYRALRIARGDRRPIEGFDQDPYVRNANFGRHTLRTLVDELQIVRQASLALLRSLDAGDWTRRGTANNAEVTPRALAFIMAGHELHHRRILKDRYLAP
jgi:uncharacterized damage-inducible protein DinB